MKDNQFLMLDPIETYKSILDGSVNKFPPGFFSANGTTNYLDLGQVFRHIFLRIYIFFQAPLVSCYKY